MPWSAATGGADIGIWQNDEAAAAMVSYLKVVPHSHDRQVPDGSYPFIDERLPLSEMTMVEAPRELEKLFTSQAAADGVEILRDAPVELRCRSEEYPDATFLIYWPHGSDAFICWCRPIRRRQGLTANEFGFAGRTSGVAAQTRPLKQAGQGFSIDGFAFPNGHDFPTQSRQFRSGLRSRSTLRSNLPCQNWHASSVWSSSCNWRGDAKSIRERKELFSASERRDRVCPADLVVEVESATRPRARTFARVVPATCRTF